MAEAKKPEAVGQPWEPPPEEPTNPRIKRSNLLTRIIVIAASGGFSALSLGGVALAYDKLETKAADAGAAAAQAEVKELAKETAKVTEAVKAHEARLESVEHRTLRTEADVHEARGELRDLYKAVMEGKRSERLERPVPPIDGGRP